MKTELIFFDTFENGLEGTKRGLIAFISLIILDFIWFKLSKNLYKKTSLVSDNLNIYSALIVYLLLCSAIAVQLPKSLTEAVVYGALVGFVIYGVFNFTLNSINKQWNLSISIMDTAWGTFNCAIAALIIYLIYWKKW